jgi:hypothetical protein
LFFEKKNQKTSAYQGVTLQRRAPQLAKVFASFSKKKSFLLFLLPPPLTPPGHPHTNQGP